MEETIQLQIKVNLDALLGELQHALQYSIHLVSIALRSEIPSEPEKLCLPTDGISTIFDSRLQWSHEEAGQHFHTWALSNGLRDAIEGVSSFIESAHQVLSAWAFVERQNGDTLLRYSDWETSMDGKAFHRFGLPDKLTHIQQEHGIDLDKDLQRHVLSVNTARNCLVHRRGIVSERDLNSQSDKKLTVEWRKLYTFLEDEDGEHEIVIGQPTKKESWLCVKMLDGKKIFSLGDQLKFTTQEFADITWGLFAFGSDLVQKMSAAGLTKGFLTPHTSAQQEADLQDQSKPQQRKPPETP
jgi:hypothetical protein